MHKETDAKIVEYLERANRLMSDCRERLIIEKEYTNDTLQRIEIAKMIQFEEIKEYGVMIDGIEDQKWKQRHG